MLERSRSSRVAARAYASGVSKVSIEVVGFALLRLRRLCGVWLADSRGIMVIVDAMDQIMASDDDLGSNTVGSDIPRKSVFDRLKVDDRLKFPKDMSFAGVVGSTDTDASLSFYPLADKGKACVRIPDVLAKQVMDQHKTTLFGYFLGPRIPFPLVERYVKAAWGRNGFSAAMMNSNGIYFFKFNDLGGASQVVENGPLMIRGVPLFVAHWDPSKGLVKPVHNSCPLWVKLHNIPLVAFNKEGLSRITSALGVPKQMDACTASMCDKAWGRPGFAKVLVEVWAVGELKREVQVVIPSLTGGGDTSVNVQVEYIWEPTQCTHCMVFGHKAATCVKAVSVTKPKPENKDDQGFIRVSRKEWKPKKLVTTTQAPVVTRKEGEGTSGSSKDVGVTGMVETIDVDSSHVVMNADRSEPSSAMGDQVDNTSIETPIVVEEITVPPPKVSPVHEPQTKLDKPPLKGILKNTNRFAPLGSDLKDQRRVDDGMKSKKDSGSKRPGLEGGGKLKSVSHSTCDRVFRRWSWISNQMYSDVGTRIIVAWDNSVVDLMVLESHSQFMHCEIRFHDTQDSFFVSFVYAANRGSDRRALWSGLRKFKVLLGDKPWGQSRRNADMLEFAACVEDVELFDVRFMGVHHTWCQKPREEAGLRRKLDRILANTDFTGVFQDATARFLPRGLSDHSLGLISFKGDLKKRNYGFKFDNFLVQDSKFLDIVKCHWNVHIEGTFMYRLTSKLKMLKSPLRRLRSTYGNLSEKTSLLKHELDVVQLAIDLDPFNDSLRDDLEHLRGAYQQACWIDMRAAKQRAKAKWLSEGDSNTRYFHQVVKEKRHSHHVHSVCNADGQFVYGMEVATAFIDHFKSIIGTKAVGLNPCMEPDLFVTKLPLSDANHMIRPIEDVEIKDAIFQIGNDKAPGSDGFSSKFFKATWEVTGSDVLLAIHNFFYRGRLAKELNHTLICLLPKSVNATSVSDFRPIACCSVLYKCIAKVIVERMKPYLGNLISNSQSAFIPGRKICDNILMAHELVVGYHLSKGPPRCAFKIDLRKAYDMVNWEYLFNMLQGLGFHPVLIRWIKEMVSTTSFSLCLNGESVGYFQGERGIRQGDPLSPYLFTIIMEGFGMLFKNCIAEAEAFGYHHGCADLHLTHLCFADDLFVFTHGDVASVGILKKALDLFASRSGLSPNLQKSDVFFGNVAESEKLAILTCLPFREGSFPIRCQKPPSNFSADKRNHDNNEWLGRIPPTRNRTLIEAGKGGNRF
ncbi:hypothetical protein OSB04_un000586 [Centaurea solstitialis]|uniref:Reverse transcriptase domain-containing protein n=1 Tax=Centaurea solstitialis TaxID=347529 RepID=A0AA38VVD4_9ASTR|nr:hypothetical protein OSB04_un000586 [Centaurea solstitialis]